ncbi:extracellular solute-binding protein [Paenibacillaceae bacterium WGS1546]|uniref:extracellular solute-binding protein n=1 Tax=Cohnella sp. WGS1546 TaxID=3366810 RepID=UPI00372D6BC8
MRKWMSMKKGLIAISLAGLLLAGCQSGGGQSGANEPGSKSGSNGKAATGAEISFMVSSLESWPFNEDWWIWKALEERTNIKLKITPVLSANYEERLSAVMASGTLPDMIVTNTATSRTFGLQGPFLDFNEHLDRMPNMQAWLKDHPDVYTNSLASDGKLYIAPALGTGEANRAGWMYRDDIFSKHQLAVPRNTEELYEVLVQLKQLYPDSYPLSFRSSFARFMYMAPQWKANTVIYYDADAAAWKYGPIEDGYKEMLKYMHRLNEEKLIPPDWLTLDTKGWQDLVSTDKSFITLDYLTRIDGYNLSMRTQNPEFTMRYLPPFQGGSGGQQKFFFTTVDNSGIAVSSTTRQLDAVLSWIDFLYTEEGKELVSWGKEGETYTVVDGQRTFIDVKDLGELRSKYGLSTSGPRLWFDYDSNISVFSPEVKEAYGEAKKYDDPMIPSPAFTGDEAIDVSLLTDNLTKFMEEYTAAFVLGKRSFDTWDAYVQEAEKLGVDKLLALYQKAYDRQVKGAS